VIEERVLVVETKLLYWVGVHFKLQLILNNLQYKYDK